MIWLSHTREEPDGPALGQYIGHHVYNLIYICCVLYTWLYSIVQWVDYVTCRLVACNGLLYCVKHTVYHLVCFILNSKKPVSTSTRKITYFVFSKAAEKLKRIMISDFGDSPQSPARYCNCKHRWIPSRRQKYQWIWTRRWQDLLTVLSIHFLTRFRTTSTDNFLSGTPETNSLSCKAIRTRVNVLN
jgi:hypothetical protein